MPIASHLPRIADVVRDNRPLILRAPPGSGKTTGLPPALMSADVLPPGQIWLVQPRRLAARAAAKRVASLVGCDVGREVGYQVRFDNRSRPDSRVVAMTTGVALRRLTADPFAEGVAAVLIDEFHERSLDVDLLLGWVRRIRDEVRGDLRLVVMSATLDPGPLAEYFDGDAVTVDVDARAFEVDVRYVGPPAGRLEDAVVEAVARAVSETGGDVLAFLPGRGEIGRAAAACERDGRLRDCDVRQLYGELDPGRQDAVLAPSPGRRIILSTNVAETSLTIDGVTAVVDSGLVRRSRFDSSIGLPRLAVEAVSMASADQRAGRAGRTAPGVAYRLWDRGSERGRATIDPPEITRADLTDARLRMWTWGERDADAFPFLTPPAAGRVADADATLRRIGAVDGDGVTRRGHAIADYPLHPRLAAMLIAAGGHPDAASTAALLSERDPTRAAGRRDGRRDGGGAPPMDLRRRLEVLRSLPRDAPGSRTVARVEARLRSLTERDPDVVAPDVGDADVVAPDVGDAEPSLVTGLVAGFGDRVCRRRESRDGGVMVGGRGIDWPAEFDAAELLVALDVDDSRTPARVRLAVAVERSDLPASRCVTETVGEFDPGAGSIRSRRVVRYEDLVLSSTPMATEPSPETAAALMAAATEHPTAFVPGEGSAWFQWVARMTTLRRAGLDVPAIDEGFVSDVLAALTTRATTAAEVRRGDWVGVAEGMVGYRVASLLEREAPVRMVVPGGERHAIVYDADAPPRLEVRIGELFGMADNPSIAGGRVRVRLHLLSPAGRVEQITDDLDSFWRTTYGRVRKDLRGRYPKHHWPEDPAAATATRRGLKPRT